MSHTGLVSNCSSVNKQCFNCRYYEKSVSARFTSLDLIPGRCTKGYCYKHKNVIMNKMKKR